MHSRFDNPTLPLQEDDERKTPVTAVVMSCLSFLFLVGLVAFQFKDQLPQWNSGSERLAAGAEAPHFSGFTPQGERVSTRDSKADVQIIFFWNPQISASRDVLEPLGRLRQSYAPHQLSIIGVAVEGDPEDVRRLERSWDIQFPTITRGAMDAALAYSVNTVPTTVLVKEGLVQQVIHNDRVVNPVLDLVAAP